MLYPKRERRWQAASLEDQLTSVGYFVTRRILSLWFEASLLRTLTAKADSLWFPARRLRTLTAKADSLWFMAIFLRILRVVVFFMIFSPFEVD